MQEMITIKYQVMIKTRDGWGKWAYKSLVIKVKLGSVCGSRYLEQNIEGAIHIIALFSWMEMEWCNAMSLG